MTSKCKTCIYNRIPTDRKICIFCVNYDKHKPKGEEKKMGLGKTTNKMCSIHYKDRFIAEYLQLRYRYEKLRMANVKIKAAEYTGNKELMPIHDCPLEMLLDQERAMKNYMDILEKRAVIEGIDLEKALEEFNEAD